MHTSDVCPQDFVSALSRLCQQLMCHSPVNYSRTSQFVSVPAKLSLRTIICKCQTLMKGLYERRWHVRTTQQSLYNNFSSFGCKRPFIDTLAPPRHADLLLRYFVWHSLSLVGGNGQHSLSTNVILLHEENELLASWRNRSRIWMILYKESEKWKKIGWIINHCSRTLCTRNCLGFPVEYMF